MSEDLLYRGYRLLVRHSGPGWKVLIYAPGSAFAEPDIPNTREQAGKATVIAEAQAIVNKALGESD